MADEQVIITKFTADLSDFEAGVKKYEQSLGGAASGVQTLDKAEANLTKSTQNLSGSVGTLSDKFAVATVQEKRAAEGAKEFAGETKKAGDETKKAGGSIDQFKGGVSQLGGALGGTLNTFKTFVTGIVAGARAIGVAITTALGPVGLVIAGVVAVFGLLAKAFFGTVEGADRLRRVTEPLSAIFQTLIGVAQEVGKVIVDAFSNPKEAVSALWEAIKTNIVNRIKGVGDTFVSLGKLISSALTLDFEGVKQNAIAFGESVTQSLTGVDDLAGKAAAGFNALSGRIGAAADRGARLAQITKSLAELRIEQAKSEGALSRQFQEELEIANDITATGKEREAAAERAIEARKKITALQSGILKLEIEQLELNAANNDTSREELLIIEQKKAELNTVIADELRETQRVKKLINNLRKKETAEAAAEGKAQANESKKLSEARIAIEAKVSDALNGLAEERLGRTQTEGEKEIQAAEKKYADLEKVAKEGFQQIRDLSPPGEEAAIAQQEANILVQIEAAKQAELAAVRQKSAEELAKEREEGREQLRKTLLDDTELEREAILEKLDEDVALAEKSIENLEERNETIRKLTEQAQSDLTKIVTEEEQKRIDAETAAAEESIRLREEQFNSIKQAAADGLGILVQSAAAGEGISQESSKALLVILLDTLEKVILAQALQGQALVTTAPTPDNIATGGVSGTIKGIAMFALIKGLFTALKGVLTANYTGDPFVGGDGSRPMWSGRDGFLRRLDYGERVVTGKTNAKYYDEMQAMEDGNWDRYLDNNYILPAIESIRYNDDERAVKFVQTDMGQRMAASITLPRLFDKNIVESQMAQSKEQRRTNKLLEAMVHNTRARTTNNRYY